MDIIVGINWGRTHVTGPLELIRLGKGYLSFFLGGGDFQKSGERLSRMLE